MSNYIFASAVGRRIAPALLAASALCGTLGFASVASASEEVIVAAPRPIVEKVIVEQPRPIVEKVVVAAPRPVVEEVVVGRPRFAPVFYGPVFAPRFRGRVIL